MSAAKTIILELTEKIGLDLSSITIHDERVYAEVLNKRNFGLGKTYMEGGWSCDRLDDFFFQLQRSRIAAKVELTWWAKLRYMYLYTYSRLFNLQSYQKSLEVGVSHYDLGEELYSKMLDTRMCYSCGYWKNAETLDEAQEAKLDLICRKLGLEAGMTVLDIGCGWGGLARYAADNYGVSVLGITISKSQLAYCVHHNKTELTDFEFLDYRELLECEEYAAHFDRVVSVGMIEHVGSQNYGQFMTMVDYVLKASGLTLIHSIGGRDPKLLADPWYNTYIFPNSVLPTLTQISEAVEGVAGNPWVIEDVHNFGSDYDRTLKCWYQNFMASLTEINKVRKAQGKTVLDEHFVRMWSYYLLSSAGMFRARDIQLYQIVISKGGVLTGYQSIR